MIKPGLLLLFFFFFFFLFVLTFELTRNQVCDRPNKIGARNARENHLAAHARFEGLAGSLPDGILQPSFLQHAIVEKLRSGYLGGKG